MWTLTLHKPTRVFFKLLFLFRSRWRSLTNFKTFRPWQKNLTVERRWNVTLRGTPFLSKIIVYLEHRLTTHETPSRNVEGRRILNLSLKQTSSLYKEHSDNQKTKNRLLSFYLEVFTSLISSFYCEILKFVSVLTITFIV